MGQNFMRGKLSPAERAEVQRLGREGNYSSRQLAARFGVGKSTILRVLRGQGVPVTPRGPAPKVQQDPEPEPPVGAADPVPSPPLDPPPPVTESIPTDPLQYREHKLRELALDIAATRQRGSMHVLPPMHRLEIQLHDELTKMRTEAAEITAAMGADGLVSTIVSTMHRLPPVLRHRIQEQLEALRSGAGVVMPSVEESEADDEDGAEYG